MNIFTQFPTLETDHFYLKQVTEVDINSLFEILNQEQVVRYMGIPKAETIKNAFDELNWYNQIYQNKTGIRFGIFIKDKNKLIGSCGYKDYQEESRKAEIGYELNSLYWHKGIMTEVIQAVIKFGFNEMNLNRIHAEVDTRNVASCHLLTKVGFVKEGIMRESEFENNEFIDLIILSYLNKDYQNSK